MKSLFIFLITFQIFASEKLAQQNLRAKIGPMVRPPHLIDNHLYLLSGGGVLLKANSKFESEKVLFQTKLPTSSPLYLYGDLFLFGEGLHNHKESHLYIYNYKKEKLEKKIKIPGHIQRSPLIHKNMIIVGAGYDGLHVYDRKTYELKWKITTHKDKKLHVDANPLVYKDKICFTSIYDSKFILCSNFEGKIVFEKETKFNPKGEIIIVKNKLLTQETEANMMELKFNVPSIVRLINLDNLKEEKKIDLRGFNFFQPLDLKNDQVMFNLSTGDMITIDINNGKIGYIGEFPEPFVSTPFVFESSVCSIGLMGKLVCKEKAKDQYVITKEKRYFESPVGEIKNIEGTVYIPSRMGYFSL